MLNMPLGGGGGKMSGGPTSDTGRSGESQGTVGGGLTVRQGGDGGRCGWDKEQNAEWKGEEKPGKIQKCYNSTN